MSLFNFVSFKVVRLVLLLNDAEVVLFHSISILTVFNHRLLICVCYCIVHLFSCMWAILCYYLGQL